ncbi:Alanine--tRNA ligase [Buchnera aphidicola (Takecallis arundicolens)]|uniref:alanine--tRNA ligase n=1 Tax=Buchnera aphidicola TaxID=9 RepID=UPI0034642894
MKYTTKNIRNMFLNFFKKKKHKIICSGSLIPNKNSNLLFTNAGMNQFQDYFLGKKTYPFSKVATSQRCLRTGGKHNDLDQVGYSDYHNTFFEMLGNFSFGTYFKKESILYAWELLTDEKWFNIPKEKLFVTVYHQDYETYNIWNKIIKLSTDNIIKVYDKENKQYESDNFWQMGDTGPCGPCTEIFFKKKNHKNNIYNLDDKKQCVEIWNIVFIQFNKVDKHNVIPLNTISVDTGMGLERIASVLQNVESNYQTDIFKKIINYIRDTNSLITENTQSLHVIADHIRAAVFIIKEKIIPSNEGRGYILRRIIRRALCHGHKLNIKNHFLYKLVNIIIETNHNETKQLKDEKNYITQILKNEELQFQTTLNNGLNFLNKKIKKLKNNNINHELIFYLYDTLGFPIELTKDFCIDNNIQINQKKLDNFILNKNKNRKNQNKKNIINNIIYTNYTSKFCGYKKFEVTAVVKKIFINNQEKIKILKNETGIIILDKTPFFGESGGQIGDTGIISHNDIFHVQDTQNFMNTIGHIGTLSSGKIKINDTVLAKINTKKRLLIQNNHTTTHLLHTALKEILKYPIEQKGSFINEEYLRFDFSYPYTIKINEIYNIEHLINQNIQKNIIIKDQIIDFQQAKNEGYIFLENKIYPSKVRILSINNISKEICKGTHVQQTGEIGIVKIISYKSISSGIKRIEIMTGLQALQKIQTQEKNIKNIQNILQTHYTSLIPKIKKIITDHEKIKKENNYLNQIIIKYQEKKLIKKIKKIKTINFIMHEVNIKNIKSIKILINLLKKKIYPGIIILFYESHKKYIFVIGVTKNLTMYIKATNIIQIIHENTNSIGGGKSELAQCTSENIVNIIKIKENIQNWIKSKI